MRMGETLRYGTPKERQGGVGAGLGVRLRWARGAGKARLELLGDAAVDAVVSAGDVPVELGGPVIRGRGVQQQVLPALADGVPHAVVVGQRQDEVGPGVRVGLEPLVVPAGEGLGIEQRGGCRRLVGRGPVRPAGIGGDEPDSPIEVVELGRVAVHDRPVAGHAELAQPVTQRRADRAGADQQHVADVDAFDLLWAGRCMFALGEVPQRQAPRRGSVPLPKPEEGSGPEASGEPTPEHRRLAVGDLYRVGGQRGGETVSSKVVVEPRGHGCTDPNTGYRAAAPRAQLNFDEGVEGLCSEDAGRGQVIGGDQAPGQRWAVRDGENQPPVHAGEHVDQREDRDLAGSGGGGVLADVDSDRPLEPWGVGPVLEGAPVALGIEAAAIVRHGTITAGMTRNEVSTGSINTQRPSWNWCSPAPWAGWSAPSPYRPTTRENIPSWGMRTSWSSPSEWRVSSSW